MLKVVTGVLPRLGNFVFVEVISDGALMTLIVKSFSKKRPGYWVSSVRAGTVSVVCPPDLNVRFVRSWPFTISNWLLLLVPTPSTSERLYVRPSGPVVVRLPTVALGRFGT